MKEDGDGVDEMGTPAWMKAMKRDDVEDGEVCCPLFLPLSPLMMRALHGVCVCASARGACVESHASLSTSFSLALPPHVHRGAQDSRQKFASNVHDRVRRTLAIVLCTPHARHASAKKLTPEPHVFGRGLESLKR